MTGKKFFILCFQIFLLLAIPPLCAQPDDQEKNKYDLSPTLLKPGIDYQSVTKEIEEDRPHLLKQIGYDFRNAFTTKENWMILGAGLGASMAVRPADTSISMSKLNSELYTNSSFDKFFESGEIVGMGLVQVGGAFTTFAMGKIVSNQEIEDLGRDLFRAQILNQAFTQTVKLTVGRARPDGSSNYSFPSGHASGTFATATVLRRRYGWKAGIPAYGVASFVGLSRLSENKHYLSDVIFGAAVGIMAGRTVTIDHGRTNITLSPMAAQGGIGVQFTLQRD